MAADVRFGTAHESGKEIQLQGLEEHLKSRAAMLALPRSVVAAAAFVGT